MTVYELPLLKNVFKVKGQGHGETKCTFAAEVNISTVWHRCIVNSNEGQYLCVFLSQVSAGSHSVTSSGLRRACGRSPRQRQRFRRPVCSYTQKMSVIDLPHNDDEDVDCLSDRMTVY